ncbi:MAG: DNA-processing protein DprA [Clostridia bacterium]|nr:DNA-processing protein DprA [Clostridia bacterium]
MKIQEIDINDKDYPERLKKIKNPPKKLYVLGNKKILKNKGIAIVGSRDCTNDGVKNARLFAANIARAGFTVISGMAKGIDAAAHMGALDVEGKTIAVLGNGPKTIFPPENKEIYHKILETGGAVISEYPEDTPPESEYFRQRNRIVSGLSLGVLIVEAEVRSGTSITARFAREQGKDVFCIPNSRENSKGIGTHIQIKKGAILVLEPKEIIEKYTGNEIKQISIQDLEELNKVNLVDLSKIKDEYREIYKLLTEELSLNELSLKTGIEVKNLYQKLFMMEMEGLITSSQNKYRIVNMK